MRKLYLSTKFPHQEIRWNYGILRSVLSGQSSEHFHWVKSVRIRSYSGPYFPTFGLNMERYGVSQFVCGKMRTSITPNTNTFQAVFFFILSAFFFPWTSLFPNCFFLVLFHSQRHFFFSFSTTGLLYIPLPKGPYAKLERQTFNLSIFLNKRKYINNQKLFWTFFEISGLVSKKIEFKFLAISFSYTCIWKRYITI